MKVTVEELSPVLKKVSVEVPAETVDKAVDKAYRVIGRQARIKGFRPGKVPRRILERYYGHQVLHEVAEDLVRDTWGPVLEQEKIEAVSMPQNVEEGGHVEPGTPWTYTAQVQVLPEVQVTDYQGLEIEATRVEIATEEVDQELERLRESMAQLVPVEDRTQVEKGDYVVADMDASIDGQPFPEGKGEGFTFEVVEGDITQGNLGGAEGHAVGDTLEVRQRFPEDGQNEKLAGKEVVFQATLKGIKRREVPALDDELAKDLGEEGVDSLLALRGWLREKIAATRNQDRSRQVKDELVKALVEKNPIEVPPVLVERTAEQLLQPVLQSLAQAGIDPSQLPVEQARSMIEEVRPRAEIVVKGSLLLKAVAEQEKLEVQEEDLEKQYQQLAEQAKVPVEKVKAVYAKEEGELESLERRILEDKALAFVEEKAKITDVAPGKDETGAQVEEQKEETPAE